MDSGTRFFLQSNARYLSKHLFILYDMMYIINDEIHFKGSDLQSTKRWHYMFRGPEIGVLSFLT